MYNKGIQ